MGSDEDALWTLIEQRTHRDADKTSIDDQIWARFGTEASIMFTDLAGFSRQVARFGIIHFLQVIFEQKRLLLPLIEQHGGTLLKMEADSFMIVFAQPAAALACGIAMQHACQQANESRPPEEHVVLCLGIGHGRVLEIGTGDVFGHEVNLASKLGEDIAKANEILLTGRCLAALGEVADLGVLGVEPIEVAVAGSEKNFRVQYEHARV